MKIDPEQLVEAGQMLIGLGRHIQRTFPVPNAVGSQYGEFEVLRKLLPHDNGIYVDVGASWPKDCSNTWQFYEIGWRGLLVEPLPDCWPAILHQRPEDYLCTTAASDKDGFATLHRCRSVSSLDSTWRNDNDGSMPVMTERLETILKRYKEVDWTKTDLLSIDVEGHEWEVLNGIDWGTFTPKVIIVEYADQNGKDISAEWHPILMNRYTVHAENRLNRIYVRK